MRDSKNFQRYEKAAGTIQKAYRIFKLRKIEKPVIEKLKNTREQIIQDSMKKLVTEKRWEEIKFLSKCMNENHLHAAIQKIRGTIEKEMLSKKSGKTYIY